MFFEIARRVLLLPVKWSTCAVVIGFALLLVALSFLM